MVFFIRTNETEAAERIAIFQRCCAAQGHTGLIKQGREEQTGDHRWAHQSLATRKTKRNRLQFEILRINE
jgi:hypothetical protein